MLSLRKLMPYLMMLSLLLLSSCTAIKMPDINLGPKTESDVIYTSKYDPQGRPVKIGVVKKNVVVPIDYITDNGKRFTANLDIGGWDVSPPPLPTPLEAAASKPVPSFALTESTPQYAFHLKIVLGAQTAHGTAFLHDGYLVTCAHCMEGKPGALIWNGSEWIDAVLTKIDTAADVAYLMPSSVFAAPTAIPVGFVCVARNGKSDVYDTLTVTKEVDGFCTMKGFDYGASGSPVFKDGKLYGMARAIKQRQNWRKVMVRTDDIEVVPIAVIEKLKL